MTTRTVTAYVPLACAADGGAYAEYFAYGDYEPPGPPATGYFLSAGGTTLQGIDDEARALVITASEGASAWEGVGPVPSSGDVDVLILPTLRSCALTQTVGPRLGSTMAPIGGEEVLLVGGTGNPTPPSFVARLDTGEVAPLGAMDLQTPRTSASITPCAGGALVAGGSSDIGPLANAEVYSVSAGGFTGGTFPLSEARAQHGAVVLATGETLLVGGVGGNEGSVVLQTMDVVDAVGRAAHEEGAGNLAVARRSPNVLRLASGEILVGGGYDGASNPVTSFEWFKADTTPESKLTASLTPGTVSTMIALEAGGALVVAETPASAPAGFQNAWVIDASGALVNATPIPPPVASPVLFGGAGGAPVLWTGDRWLQWQPYDGAFGEISVLDAAPAMVGDATCSPDPGLAMWLDASDQQLTLLRFDTRNAYSSLPNPLLVTGPDETSPDRLGPVGWNINTGLTLQSGSAAFVTDRTYADVDVSVTVNEGPAAVELRDAAGAVLDLPAGAASLLAPGTGCVPLLTAGPGQTLQVHRRGATVTWSLDDTQGTCAPLLNGDGRVSVGVRASGTTPAVVMNMIVSRVGSP